MGGVKVHIPSQYWHLPGRRRAMNHALLPLSGIIWIVLFLLPLFPKWRKSTILLLCWKSQLHSRVTSPRNPPDISWKEVPSILPYSLRLASLILAGSGGLVLHWNMSGQEKRKPGITRSASHRLTKNRAWCHWPWAWQLVSSKTIGSVPFPGLDRILVSPHPLVCSYEELLFEILYLFSSLTLDLLFINSLS